ncbi:hypothetical protein ABL78_3726 [Leptomonas seymouri]|uniref:Uncharacterized protein n=1 Tax=Leptomonas seymouri TaxID=5684 RepID=A0A0N1HXJ7_LEPSE|nr:hypothetical protein ABL78_3726 [Leptomonas seymouri]|eukprot:KPI87210.1 hypothetical protein ABL78_3726 [Leptomonas seymouri]
MSATEPLTHVKVRGRHLFIPRSLTKPSSSHTTDFTDGGSVPVMTVPPFRSRQVEASLPTPEECRVLHELLAAAVLSSSCCCCDIDSSAVSTAGYAAEAGGEANFCSPCILPASVATAEWEKPLSPTTELHTNSPIPFPAPFGAAVLPSRCSNAQTMAFAVAVVLLSCTLLRALRG